MFPVIDVSGTAFERGRQHGLKARTRIAHSIAGYSSLFGAFGIDWRDARRLSLGYREAIGDVNAGLLDEMRGIAAGAGCGFDEVLALNARTEILPPSFPDRPSAQWLARRLGEAADVGECTALAVHPSASATHGTLLAQTWDWLGGQRDALILLRARREDGSGFLTLTEAGMLAKIGLNDRGFGACLNILRSDDDGTRLGLPVHVLLRALLDCDDVASAASTVAKLHYGASSNVLCADASGERAALELSPGGAHVLRGEGLALCHTNHFLAAAAAQTARPMPPALSSIPRLDRIRALVDGHAGRIGVQDVQRMLCDEADGYQSICRHPDPALPEFTRIETVAAVVMELEPRVMHVAPDIPSRSRFVPVALEPAPQRALA